MFGFALRNFTFLQDPTMTLANMGHDNVVYNNDARAFIATRAAVDLGLMTRNNVVINDFRGDVVNRGVKNTVDTQPNSRTGRFTR
jgi:ribulose-5-phosphate 4-epimerase/fuculose-1-phosphate aldolase